MQQEFFLNTPLGTMLMKFDETSINELSFVDKDGMSTADINSISILNPVAEKCINQLEEYFYGKRETFDLPLSQPGTDFQQSVWNQLQKINYGKTISYLTLSKQLGNVKAIRAVGTANGKNQIAIIVPCHRVIGSDGTLVGYAGELWRKKWLLQHEAKMINGELF